MGSDGFRYLSSDLTLLGLQLLYRAISHLGRVRSALRFTDFSVELFTVYLSAF